MPVAIVRLFAISEQTLSKNTEDERLLLESRCCFVGSVYWKVSKRHRKNKTFHPSQRVQAVKSFLNSPKKTKHSQRFQAEGAKSQLLLENCGIHVFAREGVKRATREGDKSERYSDVDSASTSWTTSSCGGCVLGQQFCYAFSISKERLINTSNLSPSYCLLPQPKLYQTVPINHVRGLLKYSPTSRS